MKEDQNLAALVLDVCILVVFTARAAAPVLGDLDRSIGDYGVSWGVRS